MTHRAKKPNVLIVIADALRADRLHCYGNPFETSPVMDRLASEGVLFRNVFAQSANTMPCVISAFTGLDPLVHGLTDPRTHAAQKWGDWATPLELLEREGYVVGGQDDWVYYHLGRHTRPQDVNEVKAFFDAHRKDDFLLWRMPDYTHLPYSPAPPYDTMFMPPDYRMSEATRQRMQVVRTKMIIHRPGLMSKFELEASKGQTGDTYSGGIDRETNYQRSAGELQAYPEDQPALRALYDGRVRTLDDEIGECVAKLAELKLLDDTIIVITGDHGEELLERGVIGHTSCSLEGTLYDEALHIPLIIRYPRLLPLGKIVETQVSQYDIMPTVFDLLGLRMPAEAEGRSLLPLISGKKVSFKEETFAMTLTAGWQVLDDDHRRIWCVRTPQWKLLFYDYAPKGPNRYELFDLKNDPGEKQNVHEQNPRVAEELKQKLHTWMKRGPSRFM